MGTNEALAEGILIYPGSLVEFATCSCLILAGFGELKTGPGAKKSQEH